MNYIDANNFKNRVKDAIGFRPDINFDFEKFAHYIVGSDRQHICTTYYTALPNDYYRKFSPYIEEAALINKLVHLRNIRVETGFYDVENQVEKGTDINLATDMLVGAYHNSYDIAIIVSADQDYKKVITTIRDMGKIVELALPENAKAGELKKNTDHFIKLTNDELKSFWYPGTGPLKIIPTC